METNTETAGKTSAITTTAITIESIRAGEVGAWKAVFEQLYPQYCINAKRLMGFEKNRQINHVVMDVFLACIFRYSRYKHIESIEQFVSDNIAAKANTFQDDSHLFSRKQQKVLQVLMSRKPYGQFIADETDVKEIQSRRYLEARSISVLELGYLKGMGFAEIGTKLKEHMKRIMMLEQVGIIQLQHIMGSVKSRKYKK